MHSFHADVDLVIEPAKLRAVEQAKKSKGGVDAVGAVHVAMMMMYTRHEHEREHLGDDAAPASPCQWR